jgi:1-deoxyxylulose-5-phosphate synthase
MKTVKLGNTGLKVSQICLGMMTYGSPAWRPWVLPLADARPIVQRAAELGINFYDTADMYSNGESEVVTGQLLKEIYRDRDDYVVASKVYFDVASNGSQPGAGPRPNRHGLSRKHILRAIDDSLARLKLDYVDLYQIHRWDSDTPIEETMDALNDVVRAGKARYIGASSMFAWQFLKAQQIAASRGQARFVSMQNHYNLAYREEEREMIPLCRDLGVALIPWSPLARGFLAGNRSREGAQAGGTQRAKTDKLDQNYYYAESDFKVADALTAVAQARGVANAQVAYAWLLAKGVTAPIVGASRVSQIEDAVASASLVLTNDEIAALEAPYQPHRVIGHG